MEHGCPNWSWGIVIKQSHMMVALGLHVALALAFAMPSEEVSGYSTS